LLGRKPARDELTQCLAVRTKQSTAENRQLTSAVLYKTLRRRQVEEVPRGLSRSTILKVFHNHALMIQSLYPGSQITVNGTMSSDSTAFSAHNPQSGVITECSLTSLEDGLGAEIEVGLGMKIHCQWTIHSQIGDSGATGGNQSSEEAQRPRRRRDSRGDLYLLEEARFDLLKPFDRWARCRRDKSHALEQILLFLEKLESVFKNPTFCKK
jgi:hypothetical protein